jgi:thiamine kinase-like enzyme
LDSHFSEEERGRIEVLPLEAGWTSARLYCLTLDEKKYVVRFQDLTQKTCEKECYMLAQASLKEVAPHVYYIDQKNGIILMDYINNATTISFEEAKRPSSLEVLGDTLRKTHCIPKPPYPLKRLFQKVQGHYDSLNSLKLLTEQMCDIMKTLQKLFHELESYNFEQTTIHGDLHVKNIFLTQNGSILFIDWEGVRYDDPFFDIAYSTCTLTLNAEQELSYLSAYLRHSPSSEEIKHYQLCKKITVLAIYFELLEWAYIRNENVPFPTIQESVKDWNWYMESFVGNDEMPAAQFIYNWAHSVLKFVPL